MRKSHAWAWTKPFAFVYMQWRTFENYVTSYSYSDMRESQELRDHGRTRQFQRLTTVIKIESFHVLVGCTTSCQKCAQSVTLMDQLKLMFSNLSTDCQSQRSMSTWMSSRCQISWQDRKTTALAYCASSALKCPSASIQKFRSKPVIASLLSYYGARAPLHSRCRSAGNAITINGTLAQINPAFCVLWTQPAR